MKTAEAIIYLDEWQPKKSGKCSVKIKVTFNRKRTYYSTGIELFPDEFEMVMNAKRRTPEQKEIKEKLNRFYTKATDVINKLPYFNIDAFEEGFFEFRDTSNSVSFAFDKYILQLKLEKRIGTAESYESAKKSLELFKKDLTFADVTPLFLKRYEERMLEQNKSITTIGIYLRSLKAIYNLQKIDKSLYPFGESRDKYSIPTGKNTKKALTIEEVAKIYNYQTPGGIKDMAKDYWLFLYLCNGMNVKDFCQLRWNNIDGEFIKYQRAKTQRTKKESKNIMIALKPEIMKIIKKWGQPSISKENYIFPPLQIGMNAEKEHATIKKTTKMINTYMKKISKELKIDKNVTTNFSRHSFATVLKRSGVKTEMISELLGHNSIGTTNNYLDSFETDQIKEQTSVLTSGFSQAN